MEQCISPLLFLVPCVRCGQVARTPGLTPLSINGSSFLVSFRTDGTDSLTPYRGFNLTWAAS